MKKIYVISVLLLSVFAFTGCTNDTNKISNTPANLREISGDIVTATLNDDGNIVIKEGDITENATYISYKYEEVIIGLLAVRDSTGFVQVVVNTCQSCGGSPYAYFVQVGNVIECQNCGNRFLIDELSSLESLGCNPIAIDDITRKDDQIIIGTEELKELKEKFENWQGPKE